MPLVIPEDYGQSQTMFSLVGSDTFGLVVFGHSFGPGVPSPSDGANAVFDGWEGANVMSLLCPPWTLEQVEMTIMSATGPITGSSTRTPQVGSSGNDGTPPNGALLVRKSSNQGGREGRGRLYLPGIQESIITPSGDISAGFQAAAQSVFTDLLANLSTNDVPMQILHSSALLTPANVTSLSVQTKLATQRRRLRR